MANSEQIKNLTLNLDLSALDELDPEARKLALSILDEYSKDGKSDLLNKLILEDYAEVPVDILTFVDDCNYLGNAWHDTEGKTKLYPYWRKELLKIFPDNITTNVNNAIFSGSRGRGKAQPLDSLIFTETGYRNMGDLKVGDNVYGSDGKLHTILGIFPQGKKPIYEVTFSDHSKTKCSDEHLWHVRDNDDMSWKTIELKDMLAGSLIRKGSSNNIKECRYKIPLTSPLEFENKNTFISPYLMGCLIGDGCFSHGISLTTKDDEVLNYMISELDQHDHTVSVDRYSYMIKRKQKRNIPNDYIEYIKKLGLYKHTAELKFIPDIYLFNDIDSRIELLQGLLDTDGTITQDGSSITYSTCSKKLADQVMFLVHTLGGTASIREEVNLAYKYKGVITPCKDCFTVALKLPKSIIPFKLTRKINRINPRSLEPQRNIKEINYIGEEECQCIYIDSESHLYLTDNLIVTHNTEIAVLIAAYLLHRILCLKDPIEFFHLKPTEKIVFAFMNIKKDLAEEIGISKFQNTIQSSPWFLSHGTIEGRTKKIWVPQKYKDKEAVDIKIGSQADDLIGLPVYFAFFDEVSFQRNQDIEKQKIKANDMIDTAIGGMKTRFIHRGKNPTILVLASSKRSDKSFLEEHMRKKLASEKENVYISDGSVWQVKPEGTYSGKTFKVAVGNKFLDSVVLRDDDDPEVYVEKGYATILDVPIEHKAEFLDDIDRALCDVAGISASSISKYINGSAVTDLMTKKIQNPFSREILEIGDGADDDVQYYNFFDISKIDPQLRNKPLFIHLDMSYTGDLTGIAGVFIKGKKFSVGELDQSNDLYFSLAFSVSIKAPKGRHISFEKNRNFIYWLKSRGFKIKGITSDTYQSYDTGEALRAKGYPYSILSVDRVDTNKVCVPYQYLKSTIYEKRLEMYNDKMLVRQIIDLERNIDSGKIDHPQGGCFTGETKVKLVDGRSLSFLELVDEYNIGKANYVYSMNLETNKIEAKPILKAWKTLENQPLVKLTFDNGESVECTLNHRFMLRNGSYIEAQHLLPGDSLMPLYTKYPSKGGLSRYRLYYEPFEDKWHFEHRNFAKDIIDEKYLVHHKDCNPNNNSPENLVWCSKTEHQKIHAEMQTGACSEEAIEKKSKNLAQWHKENKESEAYKIRADKTSKSLLRRNFELNGHNKTVEWKQHIREIENTFNVKWYELTANEKNSYGVKLSRIRNPEIQEKVVANVIKNHKMGKYQKAKKALSEYNQRTKELKKLFPNIDKEIFINTFGFEYDSIEPRKKGPWNNRYRQKLYDLKNHKVVSIEFIDKREDVYDIEVADNHNFALDAGIFVHNSKDVCDAVCGAIFNASKNAEQFAYEYGESAKQLLDANNSSDYDDAKQLTISMEEELKKVQGVLMPDRIHPSDANKKTDLYSLYKDIVIL